MPTPKFQTMTGLLAGGAVHAPFLETRVLQKESIPENFIQQLVFPDARVEDFEFLAPTFNNESLEVEDDDDVGRLGDLKEDMMSIGSYEGKMGLHGRMVRIGQMDIKKARRSGVNGQFDLEVMATNLIVTKNRRRREYLAALELKREANYAPGHVHPDVIDVVNDPDIPGLIATASNAIEDGTEHGPANLVLIGGNTIRGLVKNAALKADMAENERKFVTRQVVRDFLKIPEAPESTRIVIANARSRAGASGAGSFMLGDYIFVLRVDPAPRAEGTNESGPFIPNQRADSAGSFGWGFWMPMEQNGQQFYINRLQHGHAENISIGIQGYWLNGVENGAYGYMFHTTNGAIS